MVTGCASKPNLKTVWLEYNHAENALGDKLDRTSNPVGDYAEYIVAKSYDGERYKSGEKSYDVKVVKNDKTLKYQVKARKLKNTTSTALGGIRSWDFDYLIVVLFDQKGKIIKALEVPVKIAKNDYAKKDKYKKVWVITTTKDFLHDPRSNDITEQLK